MQKSEKIHIEVSITQLAACSKVCEDVKQWRQLISCERAVAVDCLQSNYFCRFYTSHVIAFL